jgi:hypothetical protein
MAMLGYSVLERRLLSRSKCYNKLTDSVFRADGYQAIYKLSRKTWKRLKVV